MSKAFTIERSTTINAPANAVFAQVNDFQNWRDPALKRSYDGPSAGTGARYAWVGNKNVGEGRMTIVDSRPGELVRIRLEFFKPFAANNTAEAKYRGMIVAAGGKIHVEEQKVPRMGKFSLFTDPEGRMMGLWKAKR